MPQPPSDPPLSRSSRNWWQRIVPAGGAPQDEDPPLRAELFSAEEMAAHGERLAARHVLSDGPVPDRVLGRLADNERVLAATARQLAMVAGSGRTDWYAATKRVSVPRLICPSPCAIACSARSYTRGRPAPPPLAAASARRGSFLL